MPARVYTPSEAAAIVAISPSSLRNWCGQFRQFLSPGATPEPGAERALCERDIIILQFVKEQRDQRRTYDQIIEALTAAPPPSDTIYIDTTVQQPPEPTQQVTAALQQVTGTDIVVNMLTAIADQRVDIQRQIDALGIVQGERLRWFAYGVAVGVLLVVSSVFVVWLGWALR